MIDAPHPVALAFFTAAATAALISLLRIFAYDRLLRAIVAKRPEVWERYRKPAGFFWIPHREQPFQSSMARADFSTTLATNPLPWPEDDPEILQLHTAYRKSVFRSRVALAAFLLPLIAAMLWSLSG
ncbi:MAG: hypothetical protein EAZ65_07325 [Verrucomicrobia bacterium]|nr:MAG: hypothetical protein EAZ84_12945 [Verrucomicrobiota bacterium]TAE87162.1 MAG: hypothetical protein EAZ82_08870 [Verrucomicrobiota bacterium]TAF24966.1 MAG: hypothetical protein EAZ71_09095 [Verrucomicrobiota bacterium]TAF40707.1 MAG: hypothetical protein EAZ65_07325 [Verrucomicrobiota bacterium]